MSVFLMSSIAALAYIGVFDFKNFPAMPNSVKIIAFAAVFFTLFLLIFFLFNLRRSFSKKKKTAAAAATAVAATVVAAATEIADAPADVTRHQGGLLAAASQRYDLSSSDRIDETSGHDIIYEENGVPYINSDLARKNNQGTLNNNFIKLVESVCLPPPVPRQQDKP
jgi:hypothetical protein